MFMLKNFLQKQVPLWIFLIHSYIYFEPFCTPHCLEKTAVESHRYAKKVMDPENISWKPIDVADLKAFVWVQYFDGVE